MKILHFVEAWHGGIASYVAALIKEQSLQGHRVILLADPERFQADPRQLSCQVEEYKSSRNIIRLPSIRKSLAGVINKYNPDVVHVHSTYPGFFSRFPRSLHRRIIYTPHGWSFLKKDISVLVRYSYGIVENVLSKHAAAIMCMSFEEIREARRIGIPRSRLSMIHTGIERELIPLIKSDDGDQFDGLQVGFFGRFCYQKGADLLPELADRLQPGVIINAFGSGPMEQQLLDLAPTIKLHGWIPHHELMEEMAKMDAIIIPSRWEGFSVTALEALRAGIPIIVSGETSLTEVVTHGYNGLIMREYSAEHLADLLNNLTLSSCREMGVNARELFDRTFTFDRFYEQVIGLYNKVLR